MKRRYPLALLAIDRSSGLTLRTLKERYARGVRGDDLTAPAIVGGAPVLIDGVPSAVLAEKGGVTPKTIRRRARNGLRGPDLVAPLRRCTLPLEVEEAICTERLVPDPKVTQLALAERFGVSKSAINRAEIRLRGGVTSKRATLEDCDALAIAAETGLSASTIRVRYRNGLRGADLRAPSKRPRKVPQ